KRGRDLMQQLIGSISHSVPTVLREVITLGRTLKRRAVDVLAYFDRPGTSNGPMEALAFRSPTRSPQLQSRSGAHILSVRQGLSCLDSVPALEAITGARRWMQA